MQEVKVRCPQCATQDAHPAAIRQGKMGNTSIVDIGWRCAKCGHEWGFEFWKDEPPKEAPV